MQTQKPNYYLPTSILSSKQTVKSSRKKPPINQVYHHEAISNPKKRNNSSYIQNSNKKKLQEAGYSHKKYNSNSSFDNHKHKIFEVEHMIPQGLGPKSTKVQSQPRVYSAITSTNNNNNQHNKSISHKKKIKRNFRNNQSLGEIGSCKKVIVEKTKAMSSCERKVRTKGLGVDESPIRKQDNIKTDLDEGNVGREIIVRNEENQQELNRRIAVKQKNNNCNPTHKDNQQNHPQNQDLSRLAYIDVQQLKHLNQLTSNQLSQLQSRSQTIDLLKFTIKTKLQKDPLSQSPHKLNSLLSFYQKAPNSQYIQQIMRLKQLQTNFYVEKITTLQNELNRYRKQAEKQEKEGKAKWQQESRKVLVEKSRLQEENTLLKRENEALRTIIMKKLKPNHSSKVNNSDHQHTGNLTTINEYQSQLAQ